MEHITIVTPGNIEVEYRLANAGSRLAAFLLDFFIQMTSILFLLWLVYLGSNGVEAQLPEGASSSMMAIVLVVIFAIHVGYFILCELAMNGQTIGKRVFRLRVIRDNGQPIGLSQALVRNLIRSSVDMLYIGLFVILFSKKHKRLGDMAAGTIVISEHPKPLPPSSFVPQTDLSDILPARPLTPEEQRLINEWLRRRHNLPHDGEAIREMFAAYFGKIKEQERKEQEMREQAMNAQPIFEMEMSGQPIHE